MARRRKIYAPSEAGITAAVLQHWLTLGLPNTLVAAIPNAFAHGQPGLTKGLADLLVITPRIRVGFIELKRDENSSISDEQRAFAFLCHCLRIPYERTIGRDEPIAVLEDWGAVRRTQPQPNRAAGGYARAASLTPEERSAIASTAAQARWSRAAP
jgi:hypothetical protein